MNLQLIVTEELREDIWHIVYGWANSEPAVAGHGMVMSDVDDIIGLVIEHIQANDVNDTIEMVVERTQEQAKEVQP